MAKIAVKWGCYGKPDQAWLTRKEVLAMPNGTRVIDSDENKYIVLRGFSDNSKHLIWLDPSSGITLDTDYDPSDKFVVSDEPVTITFAD